LRQSRYRELWQLLSPGSKLLATVLPRQRRRLQQDRPGTSLFPASPTSGVTGNVLVRIVNAGLRMHVPSIIGALTTRRLSRRASRLRLFPVYR